MPVFGIPTYIGLPSTYMGRRKTHMLCWLALICLLAPSPLLAKGESNMVDRARQLLDQGQLTASKDILDKILKENPDTAPALEMRGKIALMSNNLTGAETDLAHAYRLEPKSYETLIARAQLFRIQKHYDKSRRELDQAIEINPKRPDAFYMRGLTCLLQGMQNWAEKDLTLAIDLGKQHKFVGYAYYWRGRCRDMMSKYKEAIPDFTAAMNYAPKSPDRDTYGQDMSLAIMLGSGKSKSTRLGVLERGMCYFNIGDYRNAIKDFDQVIAQNPKETLLLEQRGEAYLFLMEPKKALRDFNQAILGNTASSDIYVKLGVTRYCLKMYDQAVRDLKTWLNRTVYREDDTAACVALLSRIYHLQGDPDSATKAQQTCMSKLKDKTGLPYQLMLLYAGNFTPASILKKAEKATRKEKIEALYCLGCYHLNKNERDKAKGFFSQLVALKPLGQIEYVASLFELQQIQPSK